MKDKKLIAVFVVLGIIFTILGGSLAYWSWQSTNAEKTNITFTVGSTFSCSANGGGDITANNYFAPTDCDNTTYAVKREIIVNTTSQVTNEIINLSMDLNITNISPALLQSDYFMYALCKNANSCNGAISGGSFKDNYDSTTQTVPLLTDEEFVGTESKTYYLYIWLDKEETNSNTMNTSFSASLVGTCTDSGNVLKKAYAFLGNSGEYFKNTNYRSNIISVSFVNEINIPDNAVNQWDVGISPSNASDVKAWLEDDGSGNNTFALKIGANGMIFANNMRYAFGGLSNVNTFDFGSLNTSEVKNMSQMFYGVGSNATNFSLNLGNKFDTSNVTNMYGMFYAVGYNAIDFNLNLGNHFDTTNVTYMVNMFRVAGVNATNFNFTLGNNFDTSNATSMQGMFYQFGQNATDFNLNLGSSFNTYKVNNMYEMFSYVGRYTNNFNLNLGDKFDTSNVTNMNQMFSYAGYSATNFSINLGNRFNTSKVRDMVYMFQLAGQNAVTWALDLNNNFDTSNVTNMYSMFSSAGQNSTTFNLNLGNNFNTSKVANMFGMFYHAGANSTNFELDLGNNFDTSNVTNMYSMFQDVGTRTINFSLSLGSKFDTSKVTNMAYMFYNVGRNATNFSLNLGNNFNTSSVSVVSSMFANTGKNTTIPFVLNFAAGNFANVTSNVAMFNGFPTSKATIYVKDVDAQNFIIAQNSGFSASNVLIK